VIDVTGKKQSAGAAVQKEVMSDEISGSPGDCLKKGKGSRENGKDLSRNGQVFKLCPKRGSVWGKQGRF
jgi:hypothetical protein